ncbi:MAG: 30S ribosome-binding factor RbfA, partial [Acutalibacteraceae bacterium]
KMANHRMDRTSEDIRRELMAILREMKDPRLHNDLISIVRVDTASDLSYCKVYISSMGGMDSAKEAVKALKNAAGFVRHTLSTRLKIRYTPNLSFIATDSIEYSANISRMLMNLDLKDEEEEHENQSE